MVNIMRKDVEKDSDDGLFSDVNEAEDEELEVLVNLGIKKNISKSRGRRWTLGQPSNPHLELHTYNSSDFIASDHTNVNDAGVLYLE